MGIEKLATNILDHLGQPLLIVNRSLEIVYANAALQEHLRLAMGEIIGHPCYAVTHQSAVPCDSAGEASCPVKDAFSSGTRTVSTHKHVYGGHLVVEEIVATPLPGSDLVIEEWRDISHLLGLVDGILPICSSCKRIRDEEGSWHQVEQYVAKHTGADFSHGLCPECLARLYPDFKPRK